MFEPISRYISGPSIFSKIWIIHLHTYLLCITFLFYLFSFRKCDHQRIPYTYAQTQFSKITFLASGSLKTYKSFRSKFLTKYNISDTYGSWAIKVKISDFIYILDLSHCKRSFIRQKKKWEMIFLLPTL